MPSPGEYKTVKARIRQYAQEIGWKLVPRDEKREKELRIFYLCSSRDGTQSGKRPPMPFVEGRYKVITAKFALSYYFLLFPQGRFVAPIR